MTTMTTKCIKFRHLMAIFSLMLIALSFTFKDSEQRFVIAGKTKKMRKKASRSIASYIPRDDVEAVPLQTESWTKSIFLEDKGGVLNNVRATFASWRAREEYAQRWNLESTGNYEVPGADYRRAFFQRQLLRYVGRRLGGELKQASEGSALEQIAQVQDALRPNTETSISKNIRLKFKARLLRGRVTMDVINPWLEYRTELTLTGNVNMWLNRRFESLDLTARVNIQPLDGTFLAELDRPVTENVIARYSARQPAASGTVDNTLQLLFNKGF